MNGFEWALLFVIVNAGGSGQYNSDKMSGGIWDTGYRTETHHECLFGKGENDTGGIVNVYPEFCYEDSERPLPVGQCLFTMDKLVQKVCLPVKKASTP